MCVHMSSSRPKTDFSVSAENEYSRQENAAEYSADNEYSAQESKRCTNEGKIKNMFFLGLQLQVSGSCKWSRFIRRKPATETYSVKTIEKINLLNLHFLDNI
jgi:hypothetical protein